MTKTEIRCLMYIHNEASRYYSIHDTRNWKDANLHNDISWRFHDLLVNYYPQQAMNYLNKNLNLNIKEVT